MSQRYTEEYLEEARKRIEEMEDSDYEFPEEFGKTNWILAALVIAVTGIWLIAANWM